MMSVQYISDGKRRPAGTLIPFKEWDKRKEKHGGLEEIAGALPAVLNDIREANDGEHTDLMLWIERDL